MTMATRCPGCGTLFKITAEQLQVREGRARCGRCRQVFNALDTLTSLPDPPVPAVPIEAEPPTPEPTGIPPAEEGQWETLPPSRAQAPAEQGTNAGNEAVAGETGWWPEEPPGVLRRRSLSWAAGAGALFLLLAGQLAYLFRVELATLYPGARPSLEQACAVLGCQIPLPQKAQFIHIEASDLQADSARPERLTLMLALRNRAPFRQAYPAIELTLTDGEGRPLARRVLLPRDYLGERGVEAQGIGPNAVTDIRLPLETGDLRPNGYRLYTFYP